MYSVFSLLQVLSQNGAYSLWQIQYLCPWFVRKEHVVVNKSWSPHDLSRQRESLETSSECLRSLKSTILDEFWALTGLCVLGIGRTNFSYRNYHVCANFSREKNKIKYYFKLTSAQFCCKNIVLKN